MTTPALPPSPADAATSLLSQLRDTNAANALIAANAMTPIVERLAIEGAVTPDLEFARKALESLQKVAIHPEKQDAAKAGAVAAAAILQIILDDNVPQVAPPKARRALKPVDVEDAVEVAPVASTAPATEDLSWGSDL